MRDRIKNILLEGRKEDAYAKYVSGMPEGETRDTIEKAYDTFIGGDPSGNHKYLDWMLKRFVGDLFGVDTIPYQADKIVELVNGFHKNVQRLQKKDINQYKTIKELDDAVNRLPKTKTQQKLEGADKIYEDKYLMVIVPKTPQGSCIYGANTQWCVAGRQGNAFRSYYSGGYLYYLIWKPNLPQNLDNYQKIARYITHGSPYEAEGEYYDSRDKRVDEGDIEWELFGVGYRKSSTTYSTIREVPKNNKPVFDSWENAKIAIDTHHAKNGMNKPKTREDDYFGDEDFEDMDDGWGPELDW